MLSYVSFTIGLVSPWFSRTFPEMIASKVAYVRDTYKSIANTFSNEVEKLHSYLDSFLEVIVINFLFKKKIAWLGMYFLTLIYLFTDKEKE